MNDDHKEVEVIHALHLRILNRLDELGFDGDPDASGNIAHHLAELVVWANRFTSETFPKFSKAPKPINIDLEN